MMSKPTLIYLDQNKWIDLARAYHNRSDGERFQPILEQVKSAVAKRTAIFPLSDAHLIETRKEPDVSRRKRLAQVMVEISQGWIIAPSSYTVPRELEVVVTRLYEQKEIPRPKVLGRGIAFAFGRTDELHTDLGISEERARVLKTVIDTPKGLALFLVGRDETLNTHGISGVKHRAALYAQKVEGARTLGKNYSKSIRKRAYIANLTYSLQPDLTEILASHRRTFDDFLGLDRNRLIDFFKDVPTLNVEIELATQRDEHWDKQVAPNDMTDISFLSVAIPYCDVVVTEKFWNDLARRKKLDKQYDTVILCDLLELEKYLLY